jgi:UDP-N-acetylglucosamine 2-epimerase (non-hydrolysing)
MSIKKLKVTTILGTRPEIIRLAVLISKFEEVFNHRLVFTAQNRQSFVGSDFFEELGLKRPDNNLENSTNSAAEFMAALFVFIENEVKQNRPDAVVILGDTNTSLCAIVLKKLGIPVYHLEAGNRSFDANVPEELNRRIVDHTADFNLTYSRYAYQNLLREGLHPRNSVVIGTPLREVLEYYKPQIQSSTVLSSLGLIRNSYFLVSAHRQENIDNPQRLRELLSTLNNIAEHFQKSVIVSTHPRLEAMMSKFEIKRHPLIQFLKPFGFIDYCSLQSNAILVLSDSGSISEESALLNFKALTLRDSMERPEALESGTIEMTGLKSDRVMAAINRAISSNSGVALPDDYQISNTSERVINFIHSTHHVRDFWSGIRPTQEG